MSEKREFSVKAKAEDGTTNGYVVEFDIFDTPNLDDGEFKTKSFIPNVVIIDQNRIPVYSKKFRDPRDDKEYTIQGNF